MGKRRKHQQSSIDLIPDDIRKKFYAMLNDPRMTQLAITAKINALLEKENYPDRLSKSAVNRAALKWRDVGEKLRESREIAKMYIGELGAEPAGETGKLLNEIVRDLVFRAARQAHENETIDPKLIKNLATSIYRLERAAKENMDLETKIRKQMNTQAVDAVEKVAKKQGASSDTIDALRAAIMEEISG